MALLLAAKVQLGPLAVPVERDAVRAPVQFVQLPEVVVLYVAGAVDVKQTEGDLVLGVGLEQEVFKGAPVGEVEPVLASSVRNMEEDAILLTLDLVLYRGNWSEHRRFRVLAFRPRILTK